MWILFIVFNFILFFLYLCVGDNYIEFYELWLVFMVLWIWLFKSVIFFYLCSINLCLFLGIFLIVWRIWYNERFEFFGDVVLELISRWEYVGNLLLLLLLNFVIIFLYDVVFCFIWFCLCYILAFICILCCYIRLKEVWLCIV